MAGFSDRATHWVAVVLSLVGMLAMGVVVRAWRSLVVAIRADVCTTAEPRGWSLCSDEMITLIFAIPIAGVGLGLVLTAIGGLVAWRHGRQVVWWVVSAWLVAVVSAVVSVAAMVGSIL